MEMFQTFEEYLAQSSVSIPLVSFIVNLIFTGVLTLILRQVYGFLNQSSMSRSKSFIKVFLFLL